MWIIFRGWIFVEEAKGACIMGCAALRRPDAKSLVNIIKYIKKTHYSLIIQ